LFQSFTEADKVIASHCYCNGHYAVLAKDTDFLIFNVPYIPLSSLQMHKTNPFTKENGKVVNQINASICYPHVTAAAFGIPRQVVAHQYDSF
jgi:hypothetical protein